MKYAVEPVHRPAGHTVYRIGDYECGAAVFAYHLEHILNHLTREQWYAAHDYAMRMSQPFADMEAAE